MLGLGITLAVVATAIGIGLRIESTPSASQTIPTDPGAPARLESGTGTCKDPARDVEITDSAGGSSNVDLTSVDLTTTPDAMTVKWNVVGPLPAPTDPRPSVITASWFLTIPLTATTRIEISTHFTPADGYASTANHFDAKADEHHVYVDRDEQADVSPTSVTMRVPVADLWNLPPSFTWNAKAAWISLDGASKDDCGGTESDPASHPFPAATTVPIVAPPTTVRPTTTTTAPPPSTASTVAGVPDSSTNAEARTTGPTIDVNGIQTRVSATGLVSGGSNISGPNLIQVEQNPGNGWRSVKAIPVDGLLGVAPNVIKAFDVTGDGQGDFLLTSFSTVSMSAVISNDGGTWRAVSFVGREQANDNKLEEVLDFDGTHLFSQPRTCMPSCATGGRSRVGWTYNRATGEFRET